MTETWEGSVRVVLLGMLGLAVVGFAGCAKKAAEPRAAIQQAIEAHLQQRQNLMLANMTFEVEDVKFSGDTAEAEVKFRSKQSSELAVSVRYRLRKQGDRWQVESSSPMSGMGGSPHGGEQAPPEPVPPNPSTPSAPAPQASH